MHIRVHYEGAEQSPWMDQLMTKKVIKLSRYLSPTAKLDIFVRQLEKTAFQTRIHVESARHVFDFQSEGDNIYESFSGAVDKASRSLSDHKRRFKEKRLATYKEAVA